MLQALAVFKDFAGFAWENKYSQIPEMKGKSQQVYL